MISKFISENKLSLKSFILGGLCAFSFAPFNFFVAAIISIGGFFFLLEKFPQKTLKIGFFYGFGHSLFGIYWIAISLLVDAAQFAWLIPFTLTLIPAALAFYFVFMALCYKKIAPHLKNSIALKSLSFALLWVLFEILRSFLFTGFPWNLLGYSMLFSDYTAQSASLFSVYGLSFLAVLFSLFPIILIYRSKIFSCFIIILFFANFAFGYFYISNNSLQKTGEKIRITQGNIKQDMKWDAYQKYQNFDKHVKISAPNKDQVKLIIWPETAVSYALSHNEQLVDIIAQNAPKNGFIITGALRLELEDNDRVIKNAFNSVYAISNNREIKFYDKHHLVPFGEYVPLQKFLPFVDKITNGAVGFSQGKSAQILEMKGLSFSPLICYEVIFPFEIIKNQRPDLLVNVTNDAWFGASSGPYQHLAAARMRAIEYGIPLARAANTGVSAFIDPFGRIVAKIDLNRDGFIDVDMLKSLNSTPFSRLFLKK